MRLRQFGRVAIAATMLTSFAACGDDDDDDNPVEDIDNSIGSVVEDIGNTVESVVEDATDGS